MTTVIIRRETYYIVCACGAVESLAVSHFPEVYAAINRLGWGLVPTQHDELMSGLGPQCRAEADIERGH